MKKTILMVFISLMIFSPAYANEEIQLAAVVSTSDSANIQANKKVYAAGDNRSSGGSGSTVRTADFEYGVIAGVVVAGTIAIFAEGVGDSTSNH